MTTIFCSKKLEKLFGNKITIGLQESQNYFGNWNGRLLIVNRKKILLFTNEKTAFSLIISNIKKADLAKFQTKFTDSFINQLQCDTKITQIQKDFLRNELKELVYCPTNNNKKIVGTMNEFVAIINYNIQMKYGNNEFTDIELASILNSYLAGTNIELKDEHYFYPNRIMQKLLNTIVK